MKLDLSVLERGREHDDAHKRIVPVDIKTDSFLLPSVRDFDHFQREAMKLAKPLHGTTTLAFIFKKGIIVAADSRATMGSYISSQTVHKILEINNRLLATIAGAACDCQYWGRYLGMQCRLYELDNGKRITVRAASKILSDVCFQYKGMGLSMGMMLAGWDEETGPALYYMDTDAQRSSGKVFSCGSGSLYAYSVLDDGYKWDLEVDEALELARRSIYQATYRDAASGGTVSAYLITPDGWKKMLGSDVGDLHYEYNPTQADLPLE